jgi:hypothetical protein
MIKNYLRYAVAAAFAAASHGAFAVIEQTESNDSIASAQPLVIGEAGSDGKGSVEVTGVLGVESGSAADDVDFFSFEGRAGDLVNVDIDGGMKLFGTGRSVDTVLAIFRPDRTLITQIDDLARGIVDEGSINRFDAYLKEVPLTVSGIYTVAVASTPRKFGDGGAVTAFSAGTNSNGKYKLIISGVTPAPQVLYIDIDIKPGAESIAPINPKARGNIPVALLSSAQFDALKVDRSSIKFGPTGIEASPLRCGKGGEDVNGDGYLDLVCHFDNQAVNFDPSDEEGIVKGKVAPNAEATAKGMTGLRPFQGRGWLKVVPVKREH